LVQEQLQRAVLLLRRVVSAPLEQSLWVLMAALQDL